MTMKTIGYNRQILHKKPRKWPIFRHLLSIP